MPAPTTTLIAIVSVIFATTFAAGSPLADVSATAAGENSQLPAGVSDLLAATPTMLSSVSAPMSSRQDKSKSKTLRTGNTVTVSGSDIVFTGSDKPTLVDTVLSMIRNSEPGTVGDDILSRSIMTVLSAEGSEHENVVKKQIEAALECRDHEEMLRTCVEALVDIAAFDDKKETTTTPAKRDDEEGDAAEGNTPGEQDA